jgi:hypothetical protein
MAQIANIGARDGARGRPYCNAGPIARSGKHQKSGAGAGRQSETWFKVNGT